MKNTKERIKVAPPVVSGKSYARSGNLRMISLRTQS